MKNDTDPRKPDDKNPKNNDPDWPAPSELADVLADPPPTLQRRYAGAIGLWGFVASVPGWFLVDNFAQLAAVAAGPLVVIGLSKAAAAYLTAPIEALRLRLLERRFGKGYREPKSKEPNTLQWNDGLLVFLEKVSRLDRERYRGLFKVSQLPPELVELERLSSMAAVPDVALTSLKKDAFRHMSHQMKTPLGQILAKAKVTSETLLDVASSNMSNENLKRIGRCLSDLEMIDRTAIHLGRLADQILSMEMVDNLSRDKIQRERADITNEILEVVSSRLQSAKDAGEIMLHFKTGPDLIARGDPGLLREMLSAIVDNSIKYSPPKSVIMIWAARTKDERFVKIMIGDEGPGIPESQMDKVFQPFYGVIGVDESGAHKYGNRQNTVIDDAQLQALHPKRGKQASKMSHGLGLSLVKAIVDVHNGTITMENMGRPSNEQTMSSGLRTTVILPAAPPDPTARDDI